MKIPLYYYRPCVRHQPEANKVPNIAFTTATMLSCLPTHRPPTAAEVAEDRARQIASLSTFLEASFTRDMLMPTKETSSKAPKFMHRDGTWSWARFKANFKRGDDICILLQDLCVIDVDSVEQADELEVRFPILKTAPCEATQRGRHYYFKRTLTTNSQGYYDGPAQRGVKGIDFKTVTRGGTGGIIVVAPSTAKVWVRPLFTTPVLGIPDELLRAVARPLHATRNVKLVFQNDKTEKMLNGCRFLRAITFFDPIFDGRWEAGGDEEEALRLTVPAEIEPRIFNELLHVIEFADLSLEPNPQLFTDLMAAADMLLIPSYLLKCLSSDRFERPIEQAGLFSVSPTWWRIDTEERTRRRNRESAVSTLVRIDAALASSLIYEPFQRDSRWLLSDLKRAGGIPVGGPALVTDPSNAMRLKLPETVLSVLQSNSENIVLAGGAVTGAVVHGVAEGNDYDIFLYSLDASAADVLTDSIIAQFTPTHDVHESKNAVTFLPKANPPIDPSRRWGSPPIQEGFAGAIFQLVLRLHRDRAQVLEGFDLAPSKALARVSPEGEIIVEAMPAWVEAMRTRAFWVDSSVNSGPLVGRVYKYISKGFDACVAGTRRECFLKLSDQRKNDASWRAIFEAEKSILKHRQYYPRTDPRRTGPLTRKEARTVATTSGFKSGYETIMKMTGRFGYIVRALADVSSYVRRSSNAIGDLARHFSRAIGLGGEGASQPVTNKATTTPQPRAWIPIDHSVAFVPSLPKMSHLYNYEKLQQVVPTVAGTALPASAAAAPEASGRGSEEAAGVAAGVAGAAEKR